MAKLDVGTDESRRTGFPEEQDYGESVNPSVNHMVMLEALERGDDERSTLQKVLVCSRFALLQWTAFWGSERRERPRGTPGASGLSQFSSQFSLSI